MQTAKKMQSPCRRIDEAFDQCALFDRVPPAKRVTRDLAFDPPLITT